MEKRGMTQELPEIEKDASFSYDEDLMDKLTEKLSKELKSKERQTVNKDATTIRTVKLTKFN